VGRAIELERFRELLAIIRAEFPDLALSRTEQAEQVDAAVDIPVQPSLSFAMHINLQGDELHLNVGKGFWVEWFPCGDRQVFNDFVDAVRGLISGEYRIVESLARGRITSARLQAPVGDRWKTLARWGGFDVLVRLTGIRKENILQNSARG
jgi:hypothetical protein